MTVCDKILDLLSRSPELYEYLASHREKLRVGDYTDIVAGAPIGIEKKRELLAELCDDMVGDEHRYVKCYTDCIDDVRRMLENADLLSVKLYGYDCDTEGIDMLDGPYLASSLENAKRAIQNYREEDDLSESGSTYWQISAYSFNGEVEYSGFLLDDCTFIAGPDGEIMYFSKPPIYADFSCTAGLVLPVPYKPGDILRIDCRPFLRDIRYCVVTEVIYPDIVECAYPGKDGSVCLGNLIHGFFFDNMHSDPCISPLYCTSVYTGELPCEYGFMKELSAKLRNDPEYGKALFESMYR